MSLKRERKNQHKTGFLKRLNMVRKRKEDFGNFVSGILQNSMLTGIPQIATAGNLYKKVIRAIVFIACLIGFIYQSMVFMQIYWEYKTVIDVQVTTVKTTEMPSITVCNFNGLYTSRICNDSRFKDSCGNINYELSAEEIAEGTTRTDWCSCLSNRWCVDGVLQDKYLPSWNLMKELDKMPHDDYKMLLQQYSEFVRYCANEMIFPTEFHPKCNFSHSLHVRCPSDRPVVSACWTINTLIGHPDEEPIMALSGGKILLQLNPHPEEYPSALKTVSAQISIHHPRTIVNPFVDGFTMQLNTENDFRLRKVVKKLLPFPYETDCVDYLEQWRARGGYGPTNQKECIMECEKNVSLKAFDGCISQYYYMPSNERRCDPYESYPLGDVLTQSHECAAKYCKPACYEETYEVVRNVRDKKVQTDCDNDYPLEDIGVRILLDGMETTTYTYSPKFQNIETFSYLGGYVGMWLGISLVALFDFLETVVIMLKYPFRKYTESKARRDRLTRIKKLQRDL